MLGERIRGLRESKCWSQAHLADAAAINVRTVQRIEAGAQCSDETLLSLAAALGVDVSVLEPERPCRSNAESVSFVRLGLTVLCLAPAAIFILLNLLRLEGVTQPFEATAIVGSRLISVPTFNTLFPFIFVGGAAAALAASLPQLVTFQSKKDKRALSIIGIELKANWPAIAIATAALCILTALIGYEALEQLFTAIR